MSRTLRNIDGVFQVDVDSGQVMSPLLDVPAKLSAGSANLLGVFHELGSGPHKTERIGARLYGDGFNPARLRKRKQRCNQEFEDLFGAQGVRAVIDSNADRYFLLGLTAGEDIEVRFQRLLAGHDVVLVQDGCERYFRFTLNLKRRVRAALDELLAWIDRTEGSCFASVREYLMRGQLVLALKLDGRVLAPADSFEVQGVCNNALLSLQLLPSSVYDDQGRITFRGNDEGDDLADPIYDYLMEIFYGERGNG